MPEVRYEPEDVVLALLAKLREQHHERFYADNVRIHPAIYKLASIPEYKKFFRLFAFDTRDYFPFSETLEDALDSLQFAGYLERTNPKGTWYQVTPALTALFNRDISERFKPEDLEIFSNIAHHFMEYVPTDENIPRVGAA